MSTHRNDENWKIHDRVISRAKQRLEQQGCYVVANPGQEKNPRGSVKRDDRRVYPDLVIRPPEEKSITRLQEVETEDSVDNDEVKQWKEYNAGESSFYLIVPGGYVSKAKTLIRNEGFSIDGFFEYTVSEGRIDISSA